MPNYKNIVDVDPKKDKQLYRIFNDLCINRESIIDCTDKEYDPLKWHGPMRVYGKKAKSLIEKKMIEPMWVHMDNQSNVVIKRLIRVPDNVVIEKKNGFKKVFFHFKRRKIV